MLWNTFPIWQREVWASHSFCRMGLAALPWLLRVLYGWSMDVCRLWSGEAGGNGPESNTLLSPGGKLSQIWIAAWWVCVWRATAGCYLGKGGIYLSGQHKIPICATSSLLELVAKAMLVHLPLMHTQLKRLGWAGPTSKIADSSLVAAGAASIGKHAVACC